MFTIPKKTIPGVNDALTLVPELKDWFVQELNPGVDLTKVAPGSDKRILWRCPTCGQTKETAMNTRVKKVDGKYQVAPCRQCMYAAMRTAPSIAATPKLLRFWDFEKNKDYDPNLTSVTLKEKVWWRCKKCGYEWQAAPNSRMYSTNDQCPCCEAGIAVMPGFNDVVTLFPEILNTFDQEENPGVDLSTLAPGSSQVVNWTCKNCGNKWSKPIINRFLHKNNRYTLIGCQKCDSKGRRKQTYAEEFPELAAMYDEQKNGRPLSVINSTERTSTRFWWTCSTCGRSFQSLLVTMINGQKYKSKGCPYCAGKRLKGKDSFAEVHPELMDEYDPSNEIDPYTVFPNTDKPAKWICRNNREHRWKATFAVRHMGYGNCPVCYHTRIVPGHTSFADVYPEYAKRWSDKNELPPEKVFYDGRVWTQWDCPDCGGTYGAYTDDMVSGKATCPYCDNRLPLAGFNSLADTHPEIIELWSKKNDRPPTGYLANTNPFVYLTCPDCGNDYGTRIQDIVSGESDCPYCNNRVALAGYNSLADVRPDIAKLWAPSNMRKPENTLPDSESFTRWICPDCGGEYGYTVREMTSGEADCPYCHNRIALPGFNSLADKFPEVAKQWSPNNDRTASDVLPHIATAALWCCPECGGEYRASIKEMVEGTADCPYCAGRRVLPGFNSFLVTHPDLMREWMFVNNYVLADPDRVSEKSTASVWWQCPTNPKHHYSMRIADKVMYEFRHRESCPYCKGLRRKKRHYV